MNSCGFANPKATISGLPSYATDAARLVLTRFYSMILALAFSNVDTFLNALWMAPDSLPADLWTLLVPSRSAASEMHHTMPWLRSMYHSRWYRRRCVCQPGTVTRLQATKCHTCDGTNHMHYPMIGNDAHIRFDGLHRSHPSRMRFLKSRGEFVH